MVNLISSPLSKDCVSQMRGAVRHVASLFPTAIISGRSRDKVQTITVSHK
jgi:trehalose 6-phosphate phosphatase